MVADDEDQVQERDAEDFCFGHKETSASDCGGLADTQSVFLEGGMRTEGVM